VLDGEPVLGISVFATLDDIGQASLDGILSGKLATYRLVHLVALRALVAAGFTVLPTFHRPHMTVVLNRSTGSSCWWWRLDQHRTIRTMVRWCAGGEGDHGNRRGHQG
jgi:hypothetical protein